MRARTIHSPDRGGGVVEQAARWEEGVAVEVAGAKENVVDVGDGGAVGEKYCAS